LSYSLSATKTLAFIVAEYGVPTDFKSMAKEIVESNKYIDALELTSGGTITHIYPLEGNESAIGYDILKDSATSKEALRAMESKELFFAGPLDLKQGGIAVVGRLPIYKDKNFIGFSVVLIKLSTLLKAAGIDSFQNKNFTYQLSKVNPITKKEEFFLPVSMAIKSRHAVSIDVPDGEWKLYVIANDRTSALFNVFGFGILGLGLSVTAGLFAWSLVRQPAKLNELVQEKTRELVAEKNLSEYIINALPGIFYFYDRSGRFIKWNKNFETVSGYSAEEMKELHPLSLFHGEEKNLLKQRIDQVFETGKSDVTAHFYTKDKQKIPYYFNGRRVSYNGFEYLIGMGIDISDRMEVENKLRERTDEIQRLTAHLEKAQEEERTRIAREIHDELGQQLTGLKMDASWIAKNLSVSEKPVQQKIITMMSLIDDTVKTVRRISSELRPGILDDLGLLPALEWQSQEFEKRTGIKTTFHAGVEDFNPERNLSTNIFRVYQEALTNIARHSKATEVKANISEHQDHIVLEVKDNGQGMDTDATNKNTLGLIGMRERALLFQGELSIQSEKQKGTVIRLKVPRKILES
jgi:PAS domain S-box-containing protein